MARSWRFAAVAALGPAVLGVAALVHVVGAAGADSTIHSCVRNAQKGDDGDGGDGGNGGQIRIVPAIATCKRGETALNWNSQGPQGAIGPQGPKGDTGAVGPAGLVGPAGPQGLKGDTGAVGAIGPVGPAGVQGPAGPRGLPGSGGAPGAQGPQGPAGPAGPMGASGGTVKVIASGISTFGGILETIDQPCPTNWQVIGGGVKIIYGNVHMTESHPYDANKGLPGREPVGQSGSGWEVQVYNENPFVDANAQTYAICMPN